MSEKQVFLTIQDIVREYQVSKSSFYTKAKQLGIKGTLLPGRTRGRKYPLEDVEKVVSALGINPSKPFLKQRGKNQLVFRRARPEDAQAMHELGERVMRESGGHSVPTKFLLQFLSLPNAEIGHVLFKGEQLIGYFTVVPLNHDAMMHVMQRDEQSIFHQLRTRQVQSTDLAAFIPETPLDIFIWEVVTDTHQKWLGRYVISAMLNFLHTLGKRGVNIQGVYAVATTPEGIHLCRRMGMEPLNLPEVTSPDWVPFVWKIQEQRNWLTKNYLQALKSYHKRQERMRHGADVPAVYSE